MTFFPSKRAISTVLSAATIIPSQEAISSFVRIFFAPPEPFVSTLIVIPSFFPAFSKASAAIYVCAIPVGQAVTARTLILSSVFISSLGSSGYFSFSMSSMILINSFLSLAERSFSLKSSSIKRVIRRERTSRCTSPSFGAAIINNKFEGSSSIAS